MLSPHLLAHLLQGPVVVGVALDVVELHGTHVGVQDVGVQEQLLPLLLQLLHERRDVGPNCGSMRLLLDGGTGLKDGLAGAGRDAGALLCGSLSGERACVGAVALVPRLRRELLVFIVCV